MTFDKVAKGRARATRAVAVAYAWAGKVHNPFSYGQWRRTAKVANTGEVRCDQNFDAPLAYSSPFRLGKWIQWGGAGDHGPPGEYWYKLDRINLAYTSSASRLQGAGKSPASPLGSKWEKG